MFRFRFRKPFTFRIRSRKPKNNLNIDSYTGITAPVPGGLQRFSLVLNVTSSARPGEHRLSAIKGMVTNSLRAWWTEYAPVVVASLPYHVYAPVRPAACAKGSRVFRVFRVPCCHGGLSMLPPSLPACPTTATRRCASRRVRGFYYLEVCRGFFRVPCCHGV